LRGRVGRSNRKAFSYLLAPPLHLNTPEARRRLKAIEEFSELGSGFNIAMQDLDIRGAGDLLGAEQSGFISEVGYETYQKILDEAILELKENEFRHVFEDEIPESARTFVSDCQVDTDLQLLIPEKYISNITERMRLYRELDNAKEEKDLDAFRQKLSDRFGQVPDEVEELIQTVKLRWMAMRVGIEKIMIKNDTMLIYFVSDPESAFYKSEAFGRVLSYVQHHTRKVRMKEVNDKLSLTVQGIGSVPAAIGVLREMG
jgi:transcription-repair coupling factor (superfamily II helicase)